MDDEKHERTPGVYSAGALDGEKRFPSEIAELGLDEEPTYTRNALQKMLEAGKVKE